MSQSWTTQNKSSTSWSNQSMTSTTFNSEIRSGQGWIYNQSNYTYNISKEAMTNRPILYNSVGFRASWSNQSIS